jgi:hypothetical protein
MSHRNFSLYIEPVRAWFISHDTAPAPRLEELAGVPSPVDAISHAQVTPTFEAMNSSVKAVDDWMQGIGPEDFEVLKAQCQSEFPQDNLDKAKKIAVETMPEWERGKEGLLKAVPHDAPRSHTERFGALGQAAMNSDVAITVFDQPLKAEPVYDGQAALDAGPSGLKDLDPVGVRSNYRVVIYDGEIRQPPVWPSDLAAELADREEEPEEDPEIELPYF